MGETLVDVTLCGKRGCELLEKIAVDTGATHMVISSTLATKLDIAPERFTDVETAAGIIQLPLGSARVTLNGKTGNLPVLIHDRNIIGRTALEILGFKVDPIAGKLESRPITT